VYGFFIQQNKALKSQFLVSRLYSRLYNSKQTGMFILSTRPGACLLESSMSVAFAVASR
jgi:hypothetical protein